MKLLLVAVSLLLGDVSANLWTQLEVPKEDTQLLSESFVYEETLQYTFFYQAVAWEEALVICEYYKSHLATVDDISKATFVASSIADSNILSEDIWIGGRKRNEVWWWYVTNDVIATKPDEYGFPPWMRPPKSPKKECLSMDRRGHDSPLFLDLDCRLRKPFICEKGISVTSDKPLPAKWVKIGEHVFILYHGRVTWGEATAFCWQHGLRLAIIPSLHVATEMAAAMMHTRPDFEHVWIGATNQFGSWSWPANGQDLPVTRGSDGYPPWREKPDSHTYKRDCLVLDTHLCENATFIGTSCDRKRDFACEEFRPAEIVEPSQDLEEDLQAGQKIHVIFNDVTWWEAARICESRGRRLAVLHSPQTTEELVAVLLERPRELKHVWLGGRVRDKKWIWPSTGQPIPDKDSNGYPPWGENETDFQNDCLNLDIKNHKDPMLYGLSCYTKQSFICETDCSSPGLVTEGEWKCKSSKPNYNNSCTLSCNEGYAIMGSRKVTCSPHVGWSGEDTTNMLPRCHRMCEVNHDIAKVIRRYGNTIGYLFVVDAAGKDEEFFSAALQFIAGVVRAFPLNYARRVGLIACNSEHPVILPFTQEDSCELIHKINNLHLKHSKKIGFEATVKLVTKQIATLNRGAKSIIFFVSSVGHNGKSNEALLAPLKKDGHDVFTLEVGVAYNRDVTPLASVGPLLRLNHYAFNHPLNLTEVAIFMTGDYYENVGKCSAAPLHPGVDVVKLDLPRWLIFRVTNMTMKELKARKKKMKKNRG